MVRRSTVVVAPEEVAESNVVGLKASISSVAAVSNVVEASSGTLLERLWDLVGLGLSDRHHLVGFMVAGDTVCEEAWGWAEQVANARPEVGLIYGDAIDITAGRSAGLHRPAWSPDLLTSQMYIGGLWWARADVLTLVVETAEHLNGLHDLALRVSERVDSVVSIPRFVASIRREDGAARADDLDPIAVTRHAERIGLPIEAEVHATCEQVAAYQPKLRSLPVVSLIVPTGGSFRTVRGAEVELVTNAVASVVEHSTYPNYEVVAVIDATSADELGERLAAIDDRVRVIRDTRPFNFAATCNLGVEHARGEVVVLLNDDTEVVTPDWIERLVARTEVPDVGAVGVRLLYADGRLQHGGVVARGGSADHLYHGYPGDSAGHHGVLAGACNMLAVTGACLAVRRDQWDAVGGMNEELPLNYNDVDLCLRLGARGYRTVFDGTTVMTHLETSSRSVGSESWEHDLLQNEWGSVLWDDPYDNPNLRVVGVAQIPRPVALSALRGDAGEQLFRPVLASPSSLPRPVDA